MPAEMLRKAIELKAYPQYLFKYRKDNDNTERIITQNQLWFSNPLDFNDPFDCNIPITGTSTLEEIKDWLKSIGTAPSEIEAYSHLLKTNPNLMKQKTEAALREIGVCCFSTMHDNILQWSHYSDYHKGICLKFDIKEDPDTFTIPIIVAYRKVMQHYNHFIHSKNIVDYLIKPKYFEWAYESEIRIVKIHSMIQKNKGLRAFRFNDLALKEIIFGVKTPENIKQKYRQLCAANNKSHVQFSEMRLDSGHHYNMIKT